MEKFFRYFGSLGLSTKQDVLQLSPQSRKIRVMKDRKLNSSHIFVSPLWHGSDLIWSTRKLGFALTTGTCSLFHHFLPVQTPRTFEIRLSVLCFSQPRGQLYLKPKKGKKKHQNIYLAREECSTLGGRKDLIFAQKIPHLEIKVLREEKVTLGWKRQRLSKSSGKQIRTRFGRTVVKRFSICYYRKRLQCTHKNLGERGLVLWVSKH